MKNMPEKIVSNRIPIRQNDEIILLSAGEIVSITVERKILCLTTVNDCKYEVNYRLKDLEMRLGTEKFIRLSRSAVVNIEFITRAEMRQGGNYLVVLSNNQKIITSRAQARVLRKQLFRI
jgi:two-component system response regulator LytT